jgi:hypothetical protein
VVHACTTCTAGRLSILARASLVDERGNTVYDVLVRPEKHVTDYRTHLTGLRRGDLDKGKVFQYVCPITVKCTGVNFYTVRTHVLKLIDGCRLVGHSLHSDLQVCVHMFSCTFQVLRIAHPPHLTFDTAQCRRLRALAQVDARKAPGLRVLTERLLRRRIQNGAHDSVRVCIYPRFDICVGRRRSRDYASVPSVDAHARLRPHTALCRHPTLNVCISHRHSHNYLTCDDII